MTRAVTHCKNDTYGGLKFILLAAPLYKDAALCHPPLLRGFGACIIAVDFNLAFEIKRSRAKARKNLDFNF